MKLNQFNSYAQYVAAQQKTDARKKPNACFVDRGEISLIATWLRTREACVSDVLCHGVRHGFELTWLLEEFPQANIIGTDLFLKQHKSVIKHDFHLPKEEWYANFDFIYTNSLDHAYDPVVAVSCWVAQLRKNGYLFITWTPDSLKVSGGDCFGAAFHEYLKLIDNINKIIDVIYCSSTRLVIVSKCI